MRDWSKYSFKDREVIKRDLFYYLFRMRMIDDDELIELFEIINEMGRNGYLLSKK